jgi:acid phosphatase
MPSNLLVTWKPPSPVLAASVALMGLLTACGGSSSSSTVEPSPFAKIQTVVVIYGENRSFDNLYGNFPGANGLSSATATATTQLDLDGKTPLAGLPAVWSAASTAPWSLVAGLPNGAFAIDGPVVNASLKVVSPDLVHRFYQNQMQINGGAMNMYAAYGNEGGLAMGHYDGSSLQLYKLAQQYTLCDNFFMGAFGGSFLNHQYLIAATAPQVANINALPAVASLASTVTPILDAKGNLAISASSPTSVTIGKVQYAQDGTFTPDGYAVNTIAPPYQPSGVPPAANQDWRLANPAGDAYEGSLVLPPISNVTTIGDTLSDKNVSWKWYAGLWNAATQEALTVADSANYQIIWTEVPGQPDFEPHHQPFNFYARFDPTTAAGAAERAAHLKDYEDMLSDISNGTLPQVSFYKPEGDLNEHPGYTDIYDSDAAMAALIAKLQASPQWANMAIIVTYDENGGFWDHVAPPSGDRWGPGNRVPTLIISPFAKAGYVDHTQYDTGAILKFLTERFGLTPLAGVRANSGDLGNAFQF